MHEMSICRGLLSQLEGIARERGARAIRRVTLRIGPLSGVEPRLLAGAFPVAMAGSIAAEAELKVQKAPIRVRCQACGTETEATPARLVCACCGEWRTQLISGDEMLLVSVEFTHAADSLPVEPESDVR